MFAYRSLCAGLTERAVWQELANSVTGAINGTVPRADGAMIPVYQGKHTSDAKTYEIAFTAYARFLARMPAFNLNTCGQFNDTEGDLFSDPPTITQEGNSRRSLGLLWADTPRPTARLAQPLASRTFCAQTSTGRQLVVLAAAEGRNDHPSAVAHIPTGMPNNAAISLLKSKVTLMYLAGTCPVSVSGDHVDASEPQSESRKHHPHHHDQRCDGELNKCAVVIRREDAKTVRNCGQQR